MNKLKSIAGQFGITAFRTRNLDLFVKGSNIYPSNILADYQPWKNDADFLKCYESIRGNTLVDIFRCYELWELVAQTSMLDGHILEVGVWRGGTGMLLACKESQYNSNTKVYLCDTFYGVVKASEEDTCYKGGEHADTDYETVLGLGNRMGLKNVQILTGIFPEQTGPAVENAKFKFCHIDVDVYQSAKDSFEFLWERLVRGGMIVFDDYGFTACDGVTKLVNEYKADNDKIVLHNLNGHGIIIKK